MPEALGGAGMSPLASHIYTEEMGWGAADFGVGIAVYGIWFIRKTKGMVAHGTNRKSSYRVIPGGSPRKPR